MRLQISKFIAALMVVAVATLTVSCELDNVDFSNSDSSTNGSDNSTSDNAEVGSGYMSLSSLALMIDLESETFSTTKADAIDTDSYYVSITNDDPNSEQAALLMTYADIKTLGGLIELLAGNYTLSARSYESAILALGWDTPEYASKDYSFVITESETTELTDDVICTLANIKASVTLTDALLAKFDATDTDNPLTVTLQFGSVTATYSLNDAGELVGESGDIAYFASQDGVSSMTLTISGMFNTAASNDTPVYSKIEWSQEIEDVAVGQYRNITINYTSSSESGNASIEVTIQSSVGETEVEVDIMNGDFFEKGEAELDIEDQTPSTDDDDETTTAPSTLTCAIEWGEGCEEYDFDTRYEISESSYPNIVIDMTSETGITTLLLEVDSDSLTPDLLGMVYLSQTMDLINPATDEMAYMLSVELGIPTGDDVEGKTSLTLDITNFMPLLATASSDGDTTDFIVTLGDASGEVTKTIMVKVVE